MTYFWQSFVLAVLPWAIIERQFSLLTNAVKSTPNFNLTRFEMGQYLWIWATLWIVVMTFAINELLKAIF
jgi:hypothetical protein